MKTKNLKKAGFTLIELLVVISIIALLSSVVLVAVQSAREKAQMSKVRSELGEFVKALEIYKTAYGHYPSSESCNSFYPTSGLCADNGSYTDFSNILGDLKSAKIYSGDLVALLKSVPGFNSDSYYVYYTTTPVGLFENTFCEKKLATQDEYYMEIVVNDATYNPVDGLNSTYIGKEHLNSGSWNGIYCSPN